MPFQFFSDGAHLSLLLSCPGQYAVALEPVAAPAEEVTAEPTDAPVDHVAEGNASTAVGECREIGLDWLTTGWTRPEQND